ncbi:hypothetical protein PWT90_03126 [Aphanocladium album]|nr:hypothetical protein PWT90_03126 [Aphanocladium album]
MSNGHDADHPTPRPDTSVSEVQRLEKQNKLLEKQVEWHQKNEDDAEGEHLRDKSTPIPTTEKQKKRHDSRKSRKDKVNRQTRKEWDQIESRKLELDQREERLRKESQTLEDEKKKLINEKRRFLMHQFVARPEMNKNKNTYPVRRGEATVNVSEEESYKDNEPDDFDATTQANSSNRSLEEELQEFDESDGEKAGENEDNKVASAPPLPPAYVGTAEPASRGISMQSAHAEEEKYHQDATPTECAASLVENSCNSCQKCSGGKQSRLSSEASWTRLLLYLVCIAFLVVGSAMLVVGGLLIQQGQKERNIWLEANGLTRTHMLAVAPMGEVD